MRKACVKNVCKSWVTPASSGSLSTYTLLTRPLAVYKPRVFHYFLSTFSLLFSAAYVAFSHLLHIALSPLSTAPINTPTHEKKEFYVIKSSAKPKPTRQRTLIPEPLASNV